MKFLQHKCVFVTWFPYTPRAKAMSQIMACSTLFTRHRIQSRGWIWKLFFWLDYGAKAIETLLFLFREKPDVVFATSPPAFCAMICGLYCKGCKARLVVDAHNTAFNSPWIRIPFYKGVLKQADAVLVHNNEYNAFLRRRFDDIALTTLHDPLNRDLIEQSSQSKKTTPFILVIVSFAKDEPLENMFSAVQNAASKFPDFEFRITGDWHKRGDLYNQYKQVRGMTFLGFVSEEKYQKLLCQSSGVLAMTTSRHVQQCAVMEAIAAGVPLITVNSETNKRLLQNAAILCPPHASAMAEALETFYHQKEELKKKMVLIRQVVLDHWEQDYQNLFTLLQIDENQQEFGKH